MTQPTPPLQCPKGHELDGSPAFCGVCGARVVNDDRPLPGSDGAAPVPAVPQRGGGRRFNARVVAAALVVLGLAVAAIVTFAFTGAHGKAGSKALGEQPVSCDPPHEPTVLGGTEAYCVAPSDVLFVWGGRLAERLCPRSRWSADDLKPLRVAPGRSVALYDKDGVKFEYLALAPGGVEPTYGPYGRAPGGGLGMALLHHYLSPTPTGQDTYIEVSCTDGAGFHQLTRSEFDSKDWLSAPPVGQPVTPKPTSSAPLESPLTARNYATGGCAADVERRSETEAATCLQAAWLADDRAGASNYGSPAAISDLFSLADPNARPADYRFVGCSDEGSKQDTAGSYYSAYTCEFDYQGQAGCSYCVLRFAVQATASLGARVTGVTGDSGD